MMDVTVMIKDGGFKSVKITPQMLGDLAKAIKEKGFEYASLLSGNIEVVGILVTGTQTGKRVILTGETVKEPT